MKREIRILGIDDAPFDKFSDRDVFVIGTMFRGGQFIDGVMSTRVSVDGNDSTDRLIEMINKCKFKPQLQCIMIDGIAFGGFNIIDIGRLSNETKIPVIVVIRKMPDIENIKKVLIKVNKREKIKLIEKAGEPVKINDIYIQHKGIDLDDAKKILKISCTHSLIPEPIRVAHLIAAGVVEGESKGRA